MAKNQKLRAIAALSIALILLAACSRGSKDFALVDRGNKLLEKKDYARAALEFRSAVKGNPKNVEAHYGLALAEIGLGDGIAAYRSLTRALDLNPNHAGAQIQMAQLLLTSRSPEDIKQAEDHARAVLDGSPDNPDALDALAAAELKLGNTDRTMELLEQARSKAPAHIQTAVELSLLKLTKKDTAGAQTVLEQAVEKAPSVQGHLILGAFYQMVGKPPDAEQQFRMVLQQDPDNALALFNLARLLRSTGRTGEAEQMYRHLADNPSSPYASTYAAYLFQAGKQKEAVAEFERLVKLTPNDVNARTRLVAAYFATGRLADAQQLLSTTLRKNPKDSAALLQRTDLNVLAGAYEDARKDLNQILHLTPDSARAHFLLSNVERAEGKPLQERQELAETLRLDPRFFTARVALARSYILAGEASSALDLMNHTPEDQRTLGYIENRNWALLASGDLQQLRSGITEGLKRATSRDLLLQDALLKLRQGNEASGRARLLEILKGNPEDLGAVDVLIQTYTAHKQLPSAIEKVRMLLSERPKSAPLHYRLGALLASAHQTDEARAAYAAALTANPQFSPARLALATLDQAEGKPDAARKELDPLLTSKTDELVARMELGFVEGKAGNYSTAIEHLRRVVEAQPGNVAALNNLAYLLADNTNETDDALKYAQKAKELAPNNVTVAGTLGWAYFRKGMYGLALQQLKDAVNREGANVIDGTAIRRYHLAMAYAKTGDGDMATRTFSTALKLDPKLPEARIAAQMVGQAK